LQVHICRKLCKLHLILNLYVKDNIRIADPDTQGADRPVY